MIKELVAYLGLNWVFTDYFQVCTTKNFVICDKGVFFVSGKGLGVDG